MALDDIHFKDKLRPPLEHDPGSQSLDDTAARTEDEVQLWKEVKYIRAMALKCSQDNACEGSWGERVYSRIFYSALEASTLRDSVGWENMSVSFQLRLRTAANMTTMIEQLHELNPNL